MGWLTTLFSSFTLNPAVAAAGAGLVAAPILIHLINRMRYRKVRFAAMEFLLASQQKNRRRVLIEQLLLLLLRVLIVIGIVLLLARLVLDPSALAMIRAGAKTHHVVLLDDSGSMRTRIGDTTAFDAAKEILRKLVAEAGRESDSQQLTLILLSQAKKNEAFFTERAIDDRFLNEVDTKLENVACTHQALDLATGLEAVRQRLLPERAGARVLHILSDFRKSDWLDQAGLLSEVTDLGKAGVAVNLVRVVGEETPNLAVTTLAGDLDTAAAGVPVRLKVGVTNFGTTIAENAAIGVTQDKRTLPIGERLAKVEPGDEVFTDFDVEFETPGRHVLRVELVSDDLPADDRRHAAVDVAAAHPVLIVDGTPGHGDGPGLLADALAPAAGLSGASPRIESIDFLRQNSLREYRAIILVNVPSLPPDAVRAVETYVREGGGLGWFVGDAVQASFYNQSLYPARAPGIPPRGAGPGAARLPIGLFPVPLAGAQVTREFDPESHAIDVVVLPVGRFGAFTGDFVPVWRGTRITTFLPPAQDWQRDDDLRADGVTTIARLKNGEPLVLGHQFGEGRVVTVLTSAGQEWTNWPRQYSYVPFVLELFKELASRRAGIGSREVGSALTFSLPAAEYDPEIRIERPDGAPASLRATPKQARPGEAAAAQELTLEAAYGETDEPGVYKTLLAPAGGGTLQESWYAFNVPVAESRIRLADPEALRKRIAGSSNVILRDPGDLGWLRVREAGREARLVLVVVLIALLVGEQALAYRLSYHPKTTVLAV